MYSNEQRFRNKITITTFWMAIFVVYIHVNNTLTYTYDLTQPFDYFVYRIEDWGQAWQQVSVPMFFIISAFLFFRNYRPEMLKKKLISRCNTLLVPYLIWNIIPWLLLILIQFIPFSSDISTKAEFSLSSFMNSIVFCDYSVLWYVRNLMIYMLLTPVIYQLVKLRKIAILIIAGIVCGNIICFNVYGYSNLVIYWAPFYLFGAWMALNKPQWLQKRASKKVIYISGGVLIFLLVEAFFPQIVLFNEIGRYIFRLMIPMPFWYLLDFFDFYRKPIWLETLSFPIYCTHAIILEFIEKIIRVEGGDNLVIAFISYFTTPIIVLAILFIGFYLLNKYLSTLYSIAFGNRGSSK